MREIEFRGKSIGIGRWAYGVPVEADGKTFICDYVYVFDEDMSYHSGCTNPYSYQLAKVEVNSETIGQYTGLCDKNGTKIFEGDIVKLIRTNMYAPSTSFHNKDLMSLHRIYWNEEKSSFYQEHFDIEKKRVTGGGSLNFNDERADQNIIEVIGNIHDNPALLEGDDE